MGHQVNYFLTLEDTRLLGRKLKEKCPLLILGSKSQSPEPVRFPDFEDAGLGRTRLRVILAPPDALASVAMQHIPQQGYWLVDSSRSPVIEMDGCYSDGRILRRGRLYYQSRFVDKGEWVEKPAAFQAWAKKVLSVARKELQRMPEESAYIGPQARLEHQQGRLQLVAL